MGIDPGILPIYIVSVLVILVAPGPDMMFMIGSGLSDGRRGALAAAFGVTAGGIHLCDWLGPWPGGRDCGGPGDPRCHPPGRCPLPCLLGFLCVAFNTRVIRSRMKPAETVGPSSSYSPLPSSSLAWWWISP